MCVPCIQSNEERTSSTNSENVGESNDIQGYCRVGSALRIGVLGDETGSIGQAREISQPMCQDHVQHTGTSNGDITFTTEICGKGS